MPIDAPPAPPPPWPPSAPEPPAPPPPPLPRAVGRRARRRCTDRGCAGSPGRACDRRLGGRPIRPRPLPPAPPATSDSTIRIRSDVGGNDSGRDAAAESTGPAARTAAGTAATAPAATTSCGRSVPAAATVAGDSTRRRPRPPRPAPAPERPRRQPAARSRSRRRHRHRPPHRHRRRPRRPAREADVPPAAGAPADRRTRLVRSRRSAAATRTRRSNRRRRHPAPPRPASSAAPDPPAPGVRRRCPIGPAPGSADSGRAAGDGRAHDVERADIGDRHRHARTPRLPGGRGACSTGHDPAVDDRDLVAAVDHHGDSGRALRRIDRHDVERRQGGRRRRRRTTVRARPPSPAARDRHVAQPLGVVAAVDAGRRVDRRAGRRTRRTARTTARTHRVRSPRRHPAASVRYGDAIVPSPSSLPSSPSTNTDCSASSNTRTITIVGDDTVRPGHRELQA